MHCLLLSSALYCEENIKQMDSLRWLSRVPATLAAAQALLENIRGEAFVASALKGYKESRLSGQALILQSLDTTRPILNTGLVHNVCGIM